MKKYSSIISAVVLGLFVLTSVSALAIDSGNALMPTVVTKEDAAKKYPMPAGKPVPVGIPADAGPKAQGFIQSPYSSKVYDCRKVGKGQLVLDEGAKKVFVRP